MQYHDYYGTLGVDKDAEANEIQRAYRKLARKYHPDINKDPAAESRFKEIGEAYEVLKDPDKRAKYDRYGSAWKSAQSSGHPPAGWEGFDFDPGGGGFSFEGGPSGFSSFFEMLFGGGGAGRRPQPPRGPRRGSDHESRLGIRLEDAAAGSSRKITVTDGQTGQARALKVTIPKGVRSGQRIRLAGRGGKGHDGGPDGDLLLRIEVEPHPHLRVEGDHLLTQIQVSPSTAALGGEAEVHTLDGLTKVKIPPGSSSGRRIRLKGKGLESGDGRSGDLFAEVRIAVPAKLSKEQKDLYKKLADAER